MSPTEIDRAEVSCSSLAQGSGAIDVSTPESDSEDFFEEEDDTQAEPYDSPFSFPEIVRRMTTMGLSGFFTTESAVRRALGDTVPQEWVDFITSQSEKTRQDFTEAMVAEFAKLLQSTDPAEVLGALFEGRSVEVNATFKLGPKRKESDDE